MIHRRYRCHSLSVKSKLPSWGLDEPRVGRGCGRRSVDKAQRREQSREQPKYPNVASHLSTRASSHWCRSTCVHAVCSRVKRRYLDLASGNARLGSQMGTSDDGEAGRERSKLGGEAKRAKARGIYVRSWQ